MCLQLGISSMMSQFINICADHLHYMAVRIAYFLYLLSSQYLYLCLFFAHCVLCMEYKSLKPFVEFNMTGENQVKFLSYVAPFVRMQQNV